MASLHWSERNNVFLSALKTLFGVRRIRTQSIIRNKHSNICLPCFLRPQTRVPFRYSSNLQWKLKEKQQQQQNNNKITNRNQTLVKQKTNKKKTERNSAAHCQKVNCTWQSSQTWISKNCEGILWYLLFKYHHPPSPLFSTHAGQSRVLRTYTVSTCKTNRMNNCFLYIVIVYSCFDTIHRNALQQLKFNKLCIYLSLSIFRRHRTKFWFCDDI